MREIVNYKTVTIHNNGQNLNTTWTDEIYIEFLVDEIVIKSISVVDDNLGAHPPITLIRSNIINNNIMCTYPQITGLFELLNTPFKLNQANINGICSFVFTDLTGSADIAGFDTKIAITLLFIQYEKI